MKQRCLSLNGEKQQRLDDWKNIEVTCPSFSTKNESTDGNVMRIPIIEIHLTIFGHHHKYSSSVCCESIQHGPQSKVCGLNYCWFGDLTNFAYLKVCYFKDRLVTSQLKALYFCNFTLWCQTKCGHCWNEKIKVEIEMLIYSCYFLLFVVALNYKMSVREPANLLFSNHHLHYFLLFTFFLSSSQKWRHRSWTRCRLR